MKQLKSLNVHSIVAYFNYKSWWKFQEQLRMADLLRIIEITNPPNFQLKLVIKTISELWKVWSALSRDFKSWKSFQFLSKNFQKYPIFRSPKVFIFMFLIIHVEITNESVAFTQMKNSSSIPKKCLIPNTKSRASLFRFVLLFDWN